jgi:hypothetical protein
MKGHSTVTMALMVVALLAVVTLCGFFQFGFGASGTADVSLRSAKMHFIGDFNNPFEFVTGVMKTKVLLTVVTLITN